MADTAQYLTLGLDQELFGIDIRNVREILDMRPISKLPHAPDFLIGMIDVRGTWPRYTMTAERDIHHAVLTELGVPAKIAGVKADQPDDAMAEFLF